MSRKFSSALKVGPIFLRLADTGKSRPPGLFSTRWLGFSLMIFVTYPQAPGMNEAQPVRVHVIAGHPDWFQANRAEATAHEFSPCGKGCGRGSGGGGGSHGLNLTRRLIAPQYSCSCKNNPQGVTCYLPSSNLSVRDRSFRIRLAGECRR